MVYQTSPEILRYIDPRTQDSGRAPSEQFAPGASGNPADRPRVSRSEVTRAMVGLLQEKHEELTRAAIEKALDGDVAALRLCLNRLTPVLREAPVQFEMPTVRSVADAMEASAALLKAVADGEVTPEQATRVMALLREHKALVEKGINVPGTGSMSLDAYRRRFPGGDHECDEAYLAERGRERDDFVRTLNAALGLEDDHEGDDDDNAGE